MTNSRWSTNDLLVLCYHTVDDDWTSELSVRTSDFKGQLDALLHMGYAPMTFTSAVSAWPSPGRRLVVTFDDGYLSVVQHALPILARRNIPATIFVPTAMVGRDRPMSWFGIDHWAGSDSSELLRSVGWTDLRRLVDAGWEVGSHSETHPMLTTAPDNLVRNELTDSKSQIEHELGTPCTSIAYPYGNVDPRVIAFSEEAGFTTGAGLHPVAKSPDVMNWPRPAIYRGDGLRRFKVKASSTQRRLRVKIFP